MIIQTKMYSNLLTVEETRNGRQIPPSNVYSFAEYHVLIQTAILSPNRRSNRPLNQSGRPKTIS